MKPGTHLRQDPHEPISTEAPSYRKRVRVLDTAMAFVDVGDGVHDWGALGFSWAQRHFHQLKF